MASFGLTPAARDNIANAMTSNVPFVIPMCAVQLHVGLPGPAGTANVSAVAQRQAATFVLAAGIISLTGNQPTWPVMPSEEVISAISLWTDLSAGYAWFTAPLQVAWTVAAGDKYILTAGNIPFTGLAS